MGGVTCTDLPRSCSHDPTTFSTCFPQELLYMSDRIRIESPTWSSGLTAPGNRLDLEGRKVVNVESNVAPRAVASETTHERKGKCLFTFAIEDGKPGNFVNFGVCATEFQISASPKYVGEDFEGWGYHADDGGVYHAGKYLPYGPPAASGDVIGMLLDLDVGTLSFLKNGRFMGVAHVLPDGRRFRPCVSTHRMGQSIVTLRAVPPNDSSPHTHTIVPEL